MKKYVYSFRKKAIIILLICLQTILFTNPTIKAQATPGRQMENLDRGIVAVKINSGVFVSWRILGTESEDVTYNLYRGPIKVNKDPLKVSNYTDDSGELSSTYSVAPIINGVEKEKSSAANVLVKNYLSIPITPPSEGKLDGMSYTYNASDCTVADLDGDHQYEILLKWEPSNAKDSSEKGYTGDVYIDAYKLNGTQLWRIDLGKNVRAGSDYNPIIAYDLDGDGKAEVVCKTSDGTMDGQGASVGSPAVDYRNLSGCILSGPEYLTVFQGKTGKGLYSTDYKPARENPSDWGDESLNNGDRFLSCIAYLDGVHPSLVTCRGYLGRMALVAYDFDGSKLKTRWTFDSKTEENSAYEGQGNDNLSVADVDGDGKDEITYGSCAIDDNGKGLYMTGLGHGSVMHLGDLDPDRPGLEVFQVHDKTGPSAEEMRDAQTGTLLWSKPLNFSVKRAMSAHIDPRYKGDQMWATTTPPGSTTVNGLYDCKGNEITSTAPLSADFAIWWDGDLMRELFDHDWNTDKAKGTPRIDKWDYKDNKLNNLITFNDCLSNNNFQGTPCLQADIFGDWREELILRASDNKSLRIYTTTDYTSSRIYTLMHDPVYRLNVACQNVGSNQPPHTGFYIGTGMSKPPTPNIALAP